VSTKRWVALVVLLAAVGGCGDEPASPGAAPPDSAAPPAAADEWAEPAPAAAAGRSAPACDLAVTFAIAADWVAKPVSADVAAAFGGPDRVACEIDAKPAGVIGFIRAYVATQADARAALDAHLQRSAQPSQQRFREVTTPAGAGWEAGYRDEESAARAFAVPAGTGTVVIEWRGLDDEEHEAGLPAYVLARTSIARS
jgi:hypothetical protein